MKRIYTLIIVCAVLIPSSLLAQEDKKEKPKTVDVIVIDEDNDRAEVGFPRAKVEVQNDNDTVAKITIGHKRWEFIEKDDKTKVRMVHVPRNEFKGHYAGVQLAFCNYLGPNYSSSLPDDADFMDINSGKSMAFSINFLQYDIGIQKRKNNLGLVTGLGWTVYNYRQDNQYRIVRNDEGITVGEPITDGEVKKSKITTSYINIPLLFEAQIPSSSRRSTAFISAGVYGGFKIGSHTKTVLYGENKKKSRDNINLNPIQYGAMVQVGFKVIKLYGTVNFSSLYEKNKGPELYPYSIGVTLMNF
ncbi:PorT family protein [Labilibacter sediminis]|nr:PorT family protein [Labilibacter sediminis]